jgi:hypothetical protein
MSVDKIFFFFVENHFVKGSDDVGFKLILSITNWWMNEHDYTVSVSRLLKWQ